MKSLLSQLNQVENVYWQLYFHDRIFCCAFPWSLSVSIMLKQRKNIKDSTESHFLRSYSSHWETTGQYQASQRQRDTVETKITTQNGKTAGRSAPQLCCSESHRWSNWQFSFKTNKHSWFQFSMSMSDRKIAALAADIFSVNVRVSFLCSSNIWFRPEIHA